MASGPIHLYAELVNGSNVTHIIGIICFSFDANIPITLYQVVQPAQKEPRSGKAEYAANIRIRNASNTGRGTRSDHAEHCYRTAR